MLQHTDNWARGARVAQTTAEARVIRTIRARDLMEWLKKDGLAPRICGHPTFDRLCAEATYQRITEW